MLGLLVYMLFELHLQLQVSLLKGLDRSVFQKHMVLHLLDLLLQDSLLILQVFTLLQEVLIEKDGFLKLFFKTLNPFAHLEGLL